MKKLIKKFLLVTLLFSSGYLQAAIVLNSQTDVYPGVTTYQYAGLSVNETILTPLIVGTESPDAQLIFGQFDDVRVANQYDLGYLLESDLDDISCHDSSADPNCIEVLDWRYVFTHTSGRTVTGFYDNYAEGNITMDWETLISAKAHAHQYAGVNFASGENAFEFETEINGVWEVETFLERESFSKRKICIGGGCDLAMLDSVRFDTVEADEYVIEASFFDKGPMFDLGTIEYVEEVPEPSSIALFALGFLLLGRRTIKK